MQGGQSELAALLVVELFNLQYVAHHREYAH